MEWWFYSNTWQRKCHFRYWLTYCIKRAHENSVGRPERCAFFLLHSEMEKLLMKHVLLHLLCWLNANYLPAPPSPPPPVFVTSSAQLSPAVSTKELARWHARNYYYKTKLTHLRTRLLPVSVSNPIFALLLSFVISLCLLNYAFPSFIQPCQWQLTSELFLYLILACKI
jgi:hypothetical protein